MESTNRAILEKEDIKLEILANIDSKLERLEGKFDQVIQILQHTAADQSKMISLLMSQIMPPLPHFQTLPPSFPTSNLSLLPKSRLGILKIVMLYSGIRVIASRILHEIFLLMGELAIMMSSYSKTNDLLQTAIHSILDQKQPQHSSILRNFIYVSYNTRA